MGSDQNQNRDPLRCTHQDVHLFSFGYHSHSFPQDDSTKDPLLAFDDILQKEHHEL
jgi:hypothetical protein